MGFGRLGLEQKKCETTGAMGCYQHFKLTCFQPEALC